MNALEKYKIQQMMDKVVSKNWRILLFVLNQFKNQNIPEKKRVEIAIVIIFWICAKKLMMNICMHEHIFIITTRSKRYVKVLLQKIHFLLFCLIFCCGRYKTHLMCKKYHHCSFLSASRQVSN